jgi:hypothetical protein
MGDDGFSYYTKAMFHTFRSETAKLDRPITPTFTLRDYDHDGCYSFYRLFMRHDSDYDAAVAILGSYQHFLTLSRAPWFRQKLERWQEEREVRDRAAAKATLIAEAQAGNVTAARALNDLYKKEGAGRPSKKDRVDEARKAESINRKVANIADRLDRR